MVLLEVVVDIYFWKYVLKYYFLSLGLLEIVFDFGILELCPEITLHYFILLGLLEVVVDIGILEVCPQITNHHSAICKFTNR